MRTINISKVIRELNERQMLITKNYGYIHIIDVIQIIKDNIKEVKDNGKCLKN